MKLKKPLSAFLAALMVGSSVTLTAAALEPHGTGILCRNWLENDPDYTFSDSYKTSVWYENFNSLELGANTRNSILSIAISQLGYHEGEDGDYSGKNTSSSGNCVEYFRLLIPNWSNNSDEWCACFVNWCLNQARVDYASSEISCWKWVGELKGMKMFENSAAYGGTYTPQPADMIFFNWKHAETKNNASSHIGYVFYTTEDRVYTIEGNADNNVTVRSYALDDPNVIGYGTPPYEEGDVPTIDHSYRDGRPRGVYVVNSSSAKMTSEPGAGDATRVPLGSRVVLSEVNGGYAKVAYGDKVGYLPTANLYLLSMTVGEDTLTYDANGGEGAPEAVTVTIGERATVSEVTPTLEGDTFLGWSRVPYNCRVDVKPGESLGLSGDTTLYAVWEKRSPELAAAAAAEGKIPAYERPTEIQSSSALLLGTLADASLLDPTDGDTEVTVIEDAEAGRVISLTSTGKSTDPYVSLDYATLCDTLRLPPVQAEEVRYMIFKVKDVSLYNVLFEVFYDCGRGATRSVKAQLATHSDWQYLVLDMSEAEGWSGELRRLRIDWTRAADAAGNTLLLSEITFAANEAQRDAILQGMYIYPAQEKLPEVVETEPPTAAPTEEPTAAPTDAPDDSPTDPDASATPAPGTTATEPGEGCASTLGGAALLLTAIAAGAVLRRKDD